MNTEEFHDFSVDEIRQYRIRLVFALGGHVGLDIQAGEGCVGEEAARRVWMRRGERKERKEGREREKKEPAKRVFLHLPRIWEFHRLPYEKKEKISKTKY